MAPYGRMLCAMLASWHCPRVNGQTLVNPAHSPSLGMRVAQVAMETGGLWLLRGNEKKGRGSPVIESNKSDRSQRRELAVNLAFDVKFIQKQAWC